MANLHIVREHALGLDQARQMAAKWAGQVEQGLGMTCRAEAAAKGERILFERSGVSGSLLVTAERFELDAKLGLLLGAFKGNIEKEILRQLDEVLAEHGSIPGKGRRSGA